MQPIGMLDSPYVHRIAISLQLLGVPFAHKPLPIIDAPINQAGVTAAVA